MNKKQKNLTNKGFSLVELIIVIAIMAVLVGVLAPQFLKYVEQSRNSTDRDNAAAMESAFMVWGTELTAPTGETLYVTDTTGTTATVTASANVAFSGTNAAALQSALKNAGLDNSTRCVSKQKWASYVITVIVESDGTVKVSNNIPD
uniref:type II secretion system protein n=1 Tax=Waltera intestinalis TaxID=2606635 RepID=UPI003FEFB586